MKWYSCVSSIISYLAVALSFPMSLHFYALLVSTGSKGQGGAPRHHCQMSVPQPGQAATKGGNNQYFPDWKTLPLWQIHSEDRLKEKGNAGKICKAECLASVELPPPIPAEHTQTFKFIFLRHISREHNPEDIDTQPFFADDLERTSS